MIRSSQRCSRALPSGASLSRAGLFVGLLGGCASLPQEEPAANQLQENTCVVDADCGEDRCRDGMCVARPGEEQDITLRITPGVALNGSDPLPVQLTLSRVDGPTERDLALPQPVGVHVRVRDGSGAVPAEVRFQNSETIPGMPSSSFTRSSPEYGADEDDGMTVLLNEGEEYTVRAEPIDTSLPPLRLPFTARQEHTLEFDYDVEFETREYRITGIPSGERLIVQAVDPATGRRVSSIAETSEGMVRLAFAPGHESYSLDLTVMANAEAASAQGECNTGRPLPRYSFTHLELGVGQPRQQSGPILVSLPAVMDPIDYEGTVELCGADHLPVTPAQVERLKVSLRSTALLTTDSTQDARVSFHSEAEAVYDKDTGTLRFCARALPGQYDVVVSPPPVSGACERSQDRSSCGCGIFAESRLVKAPADRRDQTGVILTLPTMPSLSGVLMTQGRDPMPGATIDAVARGASTGIELIEGDRGVTRYNRSRQGTSAEDGSFRVPLDVGAYDVTIKPPSESGFAWLVSRDVLIAHRMEEFVGAFTMTAPVAVSGVLRYVNGDDTHQAALTGAVIRAFSIVGESDERRAIEIGQATADDSGAFMLLVSRPELQREGWY
ncbi:MAG: hypothetical protein OXR73_04835 [Myxococcales bacterium]|nr:hypothetical protein [Myxococcales bacterium]